MVPMSASIPADKVLIIFKILPTNIKPFVAKKRVSYSSPSLLCSSVPVIVQSIFTFVTDLMNFWSDGQNVGMVHRVHMSSRSSMMIVYNIV